MTRERLYATWQVSVTVISYRRPERLHACLGRLGFSLLVSACRRQRAGWQDPPTPVRAPLPEETIMARDPIADHARRDFMRIATGGLVGLALAARPHVAVAQAPGSPLKIGMIGAGQIGRAHV